MELYKKENEKYRIRTTMQYASSIYFLILNRISYNYSPEELSFLLGQDDDYIWKLERFMISTSNLELIAHLSWVYDRSTLYFETYDDESKYEFELEIWTEDGIRYYQMDYYINSVETISFFRLMDDMHLARVVNSEKLNARERITCRLFFEELLLTDYFKKPKTSREIKHHLDQHMDNKLNVIYLKKELDLLWGRRGVALLKRSRAKSFGYRYSLHK